MIRRFVLAIIVVALLGVGANPASAIPLSDLIAGDDTEQVTDASITQGNLLFSRFRVFHIDTPDNPGPTASSEINVEGFTDPVGNDGIRFTGPFSLVDTESIDILTMELWYDVTVLDPTRLLSDMRVSIEADFEEPVRGGVSTRAMLGPVFLGATSAGSSFPDGFTVVLSEFVSGLEAFTLVSLGVDGEESFRHPVFSGNSAEISDIFVSYSLTPVPEPGTLFLLGSGLVGMGAITRRRNRGR